MKIEKLPAGKSSFDISLSPTEKERLNTEWEWGDEKYGQEIKKQNIVATCNCKGGTHTTEVVGEDECAHCGYLVFYTDLDTDLRKVRVL